MKIRVKDSEHFIQLFKTFEKVRSLLYDVETCPYVEKTTLYQELVSALSNFIRNANVDHKIEIDSKVGFKTVKDLLEQELQILRYEDKHSINPDFD